MVIPRLTWPSFLAASAAVIFTACHQKSNFQARTDMLSLPARIEQLFETTRPVCFGHFVMDIPSTATVVHGPAEAGVPIEYYLREARTIEKRVAEHLVENEKGRRYVSPEDMAKMSKFGKIENGVIDGHRLVFGSRDSVFYSIYSF